MPSSKDLDLLTTCLASTSAAHTSVATKVATPSQILAHAVTVATTEDYTGAMSHVTDSKGQAPEASSPPGRLEGVVIVVKDNISVSGMPLTANTPALKDWVGTSESECPVVTRVVRAGALVLGKAKLHELAFGITNTNSGSGDGTVNAYDTSRFAGGSSGGTAAAIASGLAPVGLGTDTGGSARIPAALNGIVGFRPTLGRYPSGGVVPLSPTRDTVGVMGRSVSDVALLDSVIAETVTAGTPGIGIATVRLGICRAFMEDLSPEVEAVMEKAIALLRQAGATIVDVELTQVLDLNSKVSMPVVLYETKRDLPAFLAKHGAPVTTMDDIVRGIASPDVAALMEAAVLGAGAPSETTYTEAIQKHRPQLQAAYRNVFKRSRVDALLAPTTPLPAQDAKGSVETVQLNGRSVPTFGTFIRNTDPSSNAGIPSITVPAGLTSGGLPVGALLDGPEGSDVRLLEVASAIEGVLGPIQAPSRPPRRPVGTCTCGFV